jgi:hypothetical protein
MEVELQQAVNEQGTRISEHAFPPGIALATAANEVMSGFVVLRSEGIT